MVARREPGQDGRGHCHGAPGLRRSRRPGSPARMNKISCSFPPEIIQQAISYDLLQGRERACATFAGSRSVEVGLWERSVEARVRTPTLPRRLSSFLFADSMPHANCASWAASVWLTEIGMAAP